MAGMFEYEVDEEAQEHVSRIRCQEEADAIAATTGGGDGTAVANGSAANGGHTRKRARDEPNTSMGNPGSSYRR